MAGSTEWTFMMSGREAMEKEELERLLHFEREDKFRSLTGQKNYRKLTEGEKRSLDYLQKKYLGG